MLQGFYWDSYDYTKWDNLTARSEELGSIFDLIWVPNSAMTRGGNTYQTMGYMPYCGSGTPQYLAVRASS